MKTARPNEVWNPHRFEDLKFGDKFGRPGFGWQAVACFPNGLELSVICGGGAYGDGRGPANPLPLEDVLKLPQPFEAAVLVTHAGFGVLGGPGKRCYGREDTGFIALGDQIASYLSRKEVTMLLNWCRKVPTCGRRLRKAEQCLRLANQAGSAAKRKKFHSRAKKLRSRAIEGMQQIECFDVVRERFDVPWDRATLGQMLTFLGA